MFCNREMIPVIKKSYRTPPIHALHLSENVVAVKRKTFLTCTFHYSLTDIFKHSNNKSDRAS